MWVSRSDWTRIQRKLDTVRESALREEGAGAELRDENERLRTAVEKANRERMQFAQEAADLGGRYDALVRAEEARQKRETHRLDALVEAMKHSRSPLSADGETELAAVGGALERAAIENDMGPKDDDEPSEQDEPVRSAAEIALGRDVSNHLSDSGGAPPPEVVWLAPPETPAQE